MSIAAKAIAQREKGGDVLENVVIRGDLSQLTPEQRSQYYMRVCESIGVNPLTKPFDYITLNGKLVLYASRACTDQLRSIHNVSVEDMSEATKEGVYIVTVKVRNGDGRTDMAKGAVTIGGLKGDALCNALMKCETKAKRRATLSICGLGMLDESEIETIPQVAREPMKTLPKKDSRDIFDRMRQEVDALKTAMEMDAWLTDNKERIKTLAEDWQDILLLRIEEAKHALRNKKATTADEEDPREFPIEAKDWIDFGTKYIAAVSAAISLDDADAIASINGPNIEKMQKESPRAYGRMIAAVAKARANIAKPEELVGDGEVLVNE